MDSVGPQNTWSPAFQSAANLVLDCQQPMFVAWGDDLTFVYNDAYAPILGAKHPWAMARPFKEVWSDIWPQISPIVDQTMGGVGSWYEDLLIPMERHGYPEEAWFSFSYTPLKVGSAICGMICAATESTDKVVSTRASRFLRELEEGLRLLADPLQIIELTQRALGTYLGANRVGYGEVDETERYFTTNDNWTDGQIDQFNGTHDLAGFGPEIHGALKRGEPLTVNDVNDDPRIASPESQAAFAYLQTRSAMTASLVKGGRMIAAMYIHCRHPRLWTAAEAKIVQDVAERTWSALELAKAQAAQDRSEDRLARFAELSPAIVWFGSGDGSRNYVNERWAEFTGRSSAETIAMGWMNSVHPDDRSNVLDAWADAASPGMFEGEARILGKDDTYRWFLLRAKPVPDDANHWIGFDTDIDDIVRTREELTKSREALEAANRELASNVEARTRDRNRMWDNSQDINIVIDEDGTFLAVNPATTKILGWPADEIVGQSVFDFILPDDNLLSQEALETATIGELPILENRYRHKDGGFRWISWVAAPYERRIYATGRHVTAEKEAAQQLAVAQEALRQAQKMEAVGQLTGGIAHDFNNIIAGVSGSLELMSTRLAQGRVSEVERYLTAASGATRRAAALTQRLLAFSRRQTLDPKPVNLNGLIDGMLDLINRSVGPEIAVETAGKAGLWNTFADPGQLESALLNLCINARDAMPDGGKITIESANRWMDDRSAKERGLTPGQYVSLCVSDNGTGMPKDVIERAFDPFFTTKPIGQGTGLGLSMVHGFAGQSGGTVRIYSEPDQGTMVCIYLPRYTGDEARDEVDGEPVEVSPAVGGPVVLLVDDEPLVRMVAAEHLQDLGYTVLEAGDAKEALQIFDSSSLIALLITDVGLPGGMNGRQLAEAIRVKRPDLEVLFITGYAENAVFNHGHLERGMHMLGKPFQMDTFAVKVADLLQRART